MSLEAEGGGNIYPIMMKGSQIKNKKDELKSDWSSTLKYCCEDLIAFTNNSMGSSTDVGQLVLDHEHHSKVLDGAPAF